MQIRSIIRPHLDEIYVFCILKGSKKGDNIGMLKAGLDLHLPFHLKPTCMGRQKYMQSVPEGHNWHIPCAITDKSITLA